MDKFFNKKHSPFWCLIIALFVINYFVFDNTNQAMWFGFMVAAFSAISNDSIQTLGTFIASNEKLRWWILQSFVGGILIITLLFGWYINDGNIAFNRLASIPQPTQYTFLELCAPIFLLIMTRFRMPVSTTFLLLSVFSSRTVIKSMILKSACGYALAFFCALVTWSLIAYAIKKIPLLKHPYNQSFWRTIQFFITGFLWCIWIMHDMANVVVFLPRQLPVYMLLIILLYLFIVTAIIMYCRGGRIQKIVAEKTFVHDIRAASIIDILYALLLVAFKEWSHIPMSTTWVFLGLLAGREIAFWQFARQKKELAVTLELITKDILRAGLGLVISLLISISV